MTTKTALLRLKMIRHLTIVYTACIGFFSDIFLFLLIFRTTQVGDQSLAVSMFFFVDIFLFGVRS